MNESRHFYLYAKGWYETTDVLADLRKVYDHAMGHDLGSANDVLRKLLHITAPFIDERTFVEFANNIHPLNAWQVGSPIDTDDGVFGPSVEDYWTRCARACMSLIRFQEIKNIDCELGLPDPEVLPLSKHALKMLRLLEKEETPDE